MFDTPLFQEHIFENILRFNWMTLSSRLWLPWLLIVGAVLALSVWLLRRQLKDISCADVFYQKNWLFNRRSIKDWLGAAFLAVAFILTGIYVFSTENSFFESFDTMGFGTMRSLKYGVVPNFDYIRVAPLAFWNLSTLYAITQNMFVIKSFLLLQLAAAVACMYFFFSYIPTCRRLVFLAVLLLTPAMLQTAQIIYPDRDIIITLMLSFICLRYFCQNKRFRWLAGFLFFMIAAIYTKETCVLFYSGILIAALLWRIWNEDIVLKSFIHPLQTIKKMPLEFLIFIGLLSYLIIYSLLTPPTSKNIYIMDNSNYGFQEILRYYWFELVLLAATFVMLLRSMFRNLASSVNPMFRDGGFLLGGITVAAGILMLHLIPTSWHLIGRTYYLLLPVLFALAWIFKNIHRPIVLVLIVAAVLAYSLKTNMACYEREEGLYYRQVADFMAKKIKENKRKTTSIFLIERPSELGRALWGEECWSSVYHYYFYPYQVVFKSNIYGKKDLPSIILREVKLKQLKSLFFPIVTQDKPSSGDWVIIHKQNKEPKTMDIIRSLPKNPVYENKLFRIYHAENN